MINSTHYINGIEVDEPQGFDEIVLKVLRDEIWQGMFFEAATSVLKFYGNGADILRAEKRSNGLASAATYRVEIECGETTEILDASFDFGLYNEQCGIDCLVSIGLEKAGCIMTLKNRYDQKVDIDKATAFDNMTLLPDYAGLNFPIELLPQNLIIGNEAFAGPTSETAVITDDPNWTATDGFDNCNTYMTVPLPDVRNESLGTFISSPIIIISDPAEPSANNHPPYPDFPFATGTAQLIGDISCDLRNTQALFRVKGSATTVISGVSFVFQRVKLFKLPVGADPLIFANFVELYTFDLYSNGTSTTTPFDTGDVVVPLDIVQGDWIYWGLYTRGSNLSDIDSFTITFDPECYYRLISEAACTATQAEVSLVNELGARVVESITDSCMEFKSDYYGRTDSMPYASTSDGCGSLRVLTNGRKIRQAEQDNHFISLQEFFEGLRGIDNIGMGLEDNTNPYGPQLLRVEPVEYFYQNVSLLRCDGVPNADQPMDPGLGVSTIQIGYEKWEVERVNGLNEFNSNKQFRTSLKTIEQPLDGLSNFIAGGIPIEVTRQQSFADSGQADTKYDDETFIICVTRSGQYNVTFDAATNSMTFDTSGTGNEFLIANITIAGSVSNNGLRSIFNTSLSSIPGDLVRVTITFSGGVTVDEQSYTVTFPGITSSGMFVEKGNIDNSSDIFSPSTAYNWRIRPMYNLMRWFKSIAQSYVNLVNSTSKLFFTSGTGNYVAAGELPAGDPCKLENKVLAENHDLAISDFAEQADAIPIYKPELIQFSYPLSIAEYLAIKANPYGYIEVQCGNGDWEKGFIKSIEYKLAQGQADFTLIKKWQ